MKRRSWNCHLVWLMMALIFANFSLTMASTHHPSNQQQPRAAALIRPQQHMSPLALYLNNDIALSASRQVPLSSHTQAQRSLTTSRRTPRIRGRRRLETTSSVNPPTYKAYYYFIQALGKSDNSGCKHPQPSFTATCPFGAFIVSQSFRSSWQSRLDCTQPDTTSIHCVPKTITDENQQDLNLEDQNGVTIACYGNYNLDGDSTDEDFDPWAQLHVSVQVEAGSYYCDKALEVKTVPHPTVITGGSVYQTVAIQKQCFVGDQSSWIFVEPTCGRRSPSLARAFADDTMLQTTQVPTEYGGRMPDIRDEQLQYIAATTTIAHCEMQDGCSAEYSCSPKCAGFDSCQVELPGFVTNSTSAFTIPVANNDCLPRDFVMDLFQGQACEFNLMCQSGICIGGVCAPDRLEDFEVCDEGSDCISQACGKHPYNGTTPIDIDSIEKKTCCPSGATFGYEGESYCTGSQPIGAACHEDAMCDSEICIFNTCRESLLADSMECEENSDCVEGVCATYHDQDVQICCPTRASIHLSEGPWCSNRPAGDACENNVNSICKSNICVEGLCQGIEQDAGAVCDNHFDCKNSACALKSPDPAAKHICCPTGEYVFLAQTEPPISRLTDVDDPNALRVCTGQPEGAHCSADQDLDTLCASGYCIDGTCRSTRLANGTDCFEDEDCENFVCAWPSLGGNRTSKICCPSNDHKHVYVPFTSSSGELVDVCTGQPPGAPCGDHNIHVLCDSGSCVDGFCMEEP